MKRLIGILLGVLGQLLMGLLAFLLLLEPAIRIIRPQSLIMKGKESFFPGDPDLQFVIKPNGKTSLARKDFTIEVQTNSLGFRDPERGPKGDAIRILALGDSFTFGWGVQHEQTFAAQMERLESEAARTGERSPIEVINAGVPGYNLYQYLISLEKKGWKVDPDIVLVGVFVQNDFSENLDFDRWLAEKKARGGVKERDEGLVPWLQAHSQAYVWLRVKYKSSYRMQRTWFRLTRPFTKADEHYKYSNLLVFRKPVPPDMEAQWRMSEQLLRRIRDEVRGRGKELLVVLIPSELQAVQAQWEEEVRHEKMSEATFDLEAANRRAAAICRSEEISVLDLLPPFRAATDAGKVLYLASDHHWNADGHQLAAKTILAYLRARGWLDKPPAIGR